MAVSLLRDPDVPFNDIAALAVQRPLQHLRQRPLRQSERSQRGSDRRHIGHDPAPAPLNGDPLERDIEERLPLVTDLKGIRVINDRGTGIEFTRVPRHALPVERDEDIDALTRRRDRLLRYPHAVEVMAAAHARLVVLVREHVVALPGEDLRQGAPYGLYALAGLSADHQRVVHHPLLPPQLLLIPTEAPFYPFSVPRAKRVRLFGAAHRGKDMSERRHPRALQRGARADSTGRCREKEVPEWISRESGS